MEDFGNVLVLVLYIRQWEGCPPSCFSPPGKTERNAYTILGAPSLESCCGDRELRVPLTEFQDGEAF
jgi:hypothetical protein